MRALMLAAPALLFLAACKEDAADLPPPVEMTAEAVGYYCQMDLTGHDGPKGQVQLEDMPSAMFFSQVRDTLAYLHMPEQNYAVTVAYVQDMSGDATWARPGPWIAAETALYVIGSDVTGGMGAPEFVPFSDEAAARAFMARHGGALRAYGTITAEEVLAPAYEAAEDAGTDGSDDISARLRALSNGRDG
ncbi:MAG: nitrous oxide reductase accessory protein NosL [Pseudooceanicola sp.]|nr:nitrous oxide reductase accessory protein NosL [Pseudooceanicola sp.]